MDINSILPFLMNKGSGPLNANTQSGNNTGFDPNLMNKVMQSRQGASNIHTQNNADFYPSANDFPFEKTQFKDYNNFQNAYYGAQSQSNQNYMGQNLNTNQQQTNAGQNFNNSQSAQTQNNNSSTTNSGMDLSSILPLLMQGKGGGNPQMASLIQMLGGGGGQGMDISSLMSAFTQNKKSTEQNVSTSKADENPSGFSNFKKI